jgi:hypothetical protein
MALACCEKADVQPGTKTFYMVSYRPASYPNSGVVCGSSNCNETALIWMTKDENTLDQKGPRVFGFPTHF